MNEERLLRLADLVETISPEKFTLRYFWHDGCGCAIGHGAKYGLFEAIEIEENSYGGECRVTRGFKWDDRTAAFAKDADISFADAVFLTCAGSYITGESGTPFPSEVAIRIRLFVEHYGKDVEERVRELETA